MQRIYQILLLATTLCAASSCQKVIDVKLKNADQRYVIEGEINDGPGPYTVTISRTRDFTENNTFDSIRGAQVIITDLTSGAADTLHETLPGNYNTTKITGVTGRAYRLAVFVNGQTFTAISTMPAQAVSIDTLYVKRSDFGGDNVFATPVYRDLAGIGNYYRLRQWIKDTAIDGSRLRSDAATDGLTYRSQLFYDTGEESGNPVIRNGDSITVELQCINRQVYDYYRTLQDATGDNSATPANPLTNVTGGALGIFNACTSRKKGAIARF